LNVEQLALGLAAGSRKGHDGESRSLRTEPKLPGVRGPKSQGDQEREGNWDVNGAGMFLKINEMRKCHPHQGFWRRGEVGDFGSRDAGEANPSGLTHAVAIRYKDSDPSEPMAVIFLGIYRLQLKSGRFSVNLNAESVRPIKDSVLRILRCPLPSLRSNRLGGKVTGRRSAAQGGTRAPCKAQAGMTLSRSHHVIENKIDNGISHHVIDSEGDSWKRRTKRSDIGGRVCLALEVNVCECCRHGHLGQVARV